MSCLTNERIKNKTISIDKKATICISKNNKNYQEFTMELIARRIWYQLTGNWLRVNCAILWGTAWEMVKVVNLSD